MFQFESFVSNSVVQSFCILLEIMMLLTSVRKNAVILLLPILAHCCSSHAKQSHDKSVPFRKAKELHKATTLSPAQITTLANLSDRAHMNELLDNICIPRVVGTTGHDKVQKYIKSSLRNLGWEIETDTFLDHTPIFGNLEFQNIIARWNPDAKRYLTLACHYDSKYENDYDFVGATDSAVPCSQLLNLAKVMRNQLQSIKDNDLSLMLLFLDGEEAFKSWGPEDSIYGARHLANSWHKNKYTVGGESDISDLDKIDLFVLLDLIGAPDPTFYDFFHETSKWFQYMSQIETTLANLKHFHKYPYGLPRAKYFQNRHIYAGIQDDHVPFQERNVPILHLIPYPFPDFWHKQGDNRNAIDMQTTENINKILRVFVASYLNMTVKGDNVQSKEHMEL